MLRLNQFVIEPALQRLKDENWSGNLTCISQFIWFKNFLLQSTYILQQRLISQQYLRKNAIVLTHNMKQSSLNQFSLLKLYFICIKIYCKQCAWMFRKMFEVHSFFFYVLTPKKTALFNLIALSLFVFVFFKCYGHYCLHSICILVLKLA